MTPPTSNTDRHHHTPHTPCSAGKNNRPQKHTRSPLPPHTWRYTLNDTVQRDHLQTNQGGPVPLRGRSPPPHRRQLVVPRHALFTPVIALAKLCLGVRVPTVGPRVDFCGPRRHSGGAVGGGGGAAGGVGGGAVGAGVVGKWDLGWRRGWRRPLVARGESERNPSIISPFLLRSGSYLVLPRHP